MAPRRPVRSTSASTMFISILRDHGKRMAMLETRVAALEASENHRTGG